jgi:hypothetical protein
VGGFDDAGGPDRGKGFHQRIGDLGGETFLDLRPSGVSLDKSCELTEADDFAVGEVGDVRLAGEGEQMMLAEGMELDVAEEDDFVVALVEDGLEVKVGVLLEAGHQFAVRSGDAVGSFEESFAIGIFADGKKDFADGLFDAGDIDPGVGHVRGRGGIARLIVVEVVEIRGVTRGMFGHGGSLGQ